jgi:hypothetical protein
VKRSNLFLQREIAMRLSGARNDRLIQRLRELSLYWVKDSSVYVIRITDSPEPDFLK